MILLLADYALKSAAVLSLCCGVAWVLRRHTAALRHSIWSAGLAITLLLAPLSAVAPICRIPLHPGTHAARAVAGSLAGDHSFAAGAERVAITRSPVRARSESRAGAKVERIHWPRTVLRLAWLLGSMILLARLSLCRIRLSRLRGSAARIVHPRILAAAERARRMMKPGVAFELLSSPRVTSPVAFGVLRPTVLLPAGAESWSEGCLRAVLMHELSHVKRRDALTQLVAEVARAVHWYNPMVWYAVDRLTHERERACDDEVVQNGVRALDYAEHLLAVAKDLGRGGALPEGALTMARAAGLEARIAALVTHSARRGRLTPVQRSVLAVNAMVLIAGLASIGGVPARPGGAGIQAASGAAEGRLAAAPVPKHEDVAGSKRASTRREDRPGEADIAVPSPRASTGPLDRARSEVPSRAGPSSGASLAASEGVDPLSDPRSEFLATPDPPKAWPSEEEIRSAKDAEFIRRLIVAARHEKLFEHDFVRERAEWALSRVRGGEVVAPLIESLGDPDWRVRAYAAWALAEIDAGDASPFIARLLDHSNWRVRAQAASSLLALGATPPMDVLSSLAADPAWQVRISVVEFLRRERGSEARRLLERMAEDPHAGTRVEVGTALSEWGAD